MAEKNLFSWTALISGLVQSGQWIDGFNLFIEMRRAGVDIVDPFILSSIVGASANLAALELGEQIHCLVLSLGYESSLFVSNALVDKCSDILAAKTIFYTMCRRDIVSWTSIIVGMAQYGRANESLSLHDEYYGDPGRFLQIITNLMGNSIKRAGSAADLESDEAGGGIVYGSIIGREQVGDESVNRFDEVVSDPRDCTDFYDDSSCIGGEKIVVDFEDELVVPGWVRIAVAIDSGCLFVVGAKPYDGIFSSYVAIGMEMLLEWMLFIYIVYRLLLEWMLLNYIIYRFSAAMLLLEWKCQDLKTEQLFLEAT
ncbi:pentatricopeptide repeat-containing protein At1g15510, chloroplastic-like, partial [Camellia sinensis]|uniref:pentatricopeptide repeat-containing protein At1g15510, chloroplastic-like n=1 Tax=Camellia sinensis TaxID=4442 RepID=UPI0010367D71